VAGRDVTRTIEAVWRIESARLIAGIARLVRDVALAEDRIGVLITQHLRGFRLDREGVFDDRAGTFSGQ